MKQGRTLQELAAELQRQATERKDYIVAQQGLEAVVIDVGNRTDVRLHWGADELAKVQPNAHKQIADELGIPRKYYDRMQAEHPVLLADNINMWLKKEPATRRMIRTLDGNVRAMLSPKYRPLDNFELANACLPKLIDLNAQVVSCELTETRLYLKAILPGLSDTLPAGMVWGNGHNKIAEYTSNEAGRVVAAIVISNSDVGCGSLRVEPSVFTTWCTNLAVMKETKMRKFHAGRTNDVGDNLEVLRDETRMAMDHAFWMQVADITAAAFNPDVFRAAVARIRQATEEKIETQDLPAVVEKAVEVLALPPASTNNILTYLAGGGDLSKWGLSSAITAASAGLEDYDMASTFERAGGEVIAMPAREWAQIAKGAPTAAKAKAA